MKKKKLKEIGNKDYNGADEILSKDGFLNPSSFIIPRRQSFTLASKESKEIDSSWFVNRNLMRIYDGWDGGGALLLVTHGNNAPVVIATSNLNVSTNDGVGNITVKKNGYPSSIVITNNRSSSSNINLFFY